MQHPNTVVLHYWYFSAGLRVKLLSLAQAVIMSIKICKHLHGCLSPAVPWSIFSCFKGRVQGQGCSMQALGWKTCPSSHTSNFLQHFLGAKFLFYKQSICIFLIHAFKKYYAQFIHLFHVTLNLFVLQKEFNEIEQKYGVEKWHCNLCSVCQ